MDPYRVAGFRCPNCPESPLREFQNRLVCDECQGILIEEADFASACSDLDGAPEDRVLAFTAAKATTKTCPRCERPFAACELEIRRMTAPVLRCEQDGLWFGAGILAKIFARVGRGRTTRTGGGLSNFSGGPVGLDGLSVAQRTAGTLAISNWRNRPRRRAKTMTPINVYRDQRLACPACTDAELKFQGDRYTCTSCAGTFVQNPAIETLVSDMAKELWQMPVVTGAAGPRPCPMCTKPLVVENLEEVAIDRCAEHGIWFDAQELTLALERASGEFDKRGLRAWVKRIFTND